MNLQAKTNGYVVQVDVLDAGVMHTVNGEELTPLEISKLALYYTLNMELELCKESEEL